MTHSENANASPTPGKPSENSNSVTRKLLPLAAFFVAFTTVMTVLIVYMDNTAIKHYQFRVNMSQDYDLLGVSQDDPQLVTYIREVHLSSAYEPNHKPKQEPRKEDEEMSEDTAFVVRLLDKKNGFFVEAGAYDDGRTSKTAYLERRLRWRGLLVQPDPRRYFALKKQARRLSKAVHACLSPSPYPKEVSVRTEGGEGVAATPGLLDADGADWFNTRVKCFPLYSVLLAANATRVDYLVLSTGGTELQVLETVPFGNEVELRVINVRGGGGESGAVKEFLESKGYELAKSFGESDVFLLKSMGSG
ncbi:unnamed protein product [Phyllotreta striolata]|uniref:Uncharacterized protein n=1 Tax=Phyllotreta striolata TaxID=444603 RepID=A0A9N9XTH8_PHYSR|nr:unnamed protein product [Phyllotreta striolata]